MNLFSEIESCLERNPHGWCSLEKAQTLAAMVLALRPSVSVEIGVFAGRSALPIALAHKHLGFGMLYAIDPWSAAASVEGYSGEDYSWWQSVDHEAIYRFFMEQVRVTGVEQVVQVIRSKSDDVTPPKCVGLLHVDGQHTDQAVRDVQRYAREVIPGGLVVMDDIGWTGGGVARAVEKLKSMGFRQLYELGTGAVFQRS